MAGWFKSANSIVYGFEYSAYDKTAKGTEHNNRYAPYLLYPGFDRPVLIDRLGCQCLL